MGSEREAYKASNDYRKKKTNRSGTGDDDTEKCSAETKRKQRIGVFTLTTRAAEAGRNSNRQGYKVTLLERKKSLCVNVE
jgi:hypothetical protein